MDRIRIRGGAPLNGSIPISGAKNAALPLMIASLLTDETLELDNVPRLADISVPAAHPRQSRRRPPHRRQAPGPDGGDRADDPPLGPHHHRHHRSLRARLDDAGELLGDRAARGAARRGQGLDARRLRHRHAPGRPPASWRWSGSAPRSRSMPATWSPGRRRACKGGEIAFPKVTVGGTHVALMAAALASGTTVIENAAREPEVVDLADCLIKMGARIAGAGTGQIVVEGVPRLHGASHEVLPDRIETGTYAMAVAMTGGDVLLENTRPDLLQLGARRARPDRGRGDLDERGHPHPPQRRRHRRRSTSRPTRSRASRPTCRPSSWR